MTIAGLVFGPIQNAISRSFEVQCDTYALQQTQNAAAFRSAFQRLARINKADPDPHPLEVFFFHDHPPISERLALADILND
jgi:STE24 endopeptidase